MPAKRLPAPEERVVVAASSFTSLWALTWLGAEAVTTSSAVTGGFAVGSVMAGSGLAVLWWKARTMRELQDAAAADEAAEAAADLAADGTHHAQLEHM